MMNCLHPQIAWLHNFRKTALGRSLITFKSADYLETPRLWQEIALPCGKCILCKKQRSWSLACRAVFESRLYDDNCFVTLTCDDEHLPSVFPSGSLSHRPFQLFAKRLRKRIGPFRHLMCGEYGSSTLRPHYHVIIFGHSFWDSYYNDDGSFVPSKILFDCWSNGHVQLSNNLNANRILYIAGYTLKDSQLGRDSVFYSKRGLLQPYQSWSRKPGLGSDYFGLHLDDIYKPSGSKWIAHDLVKSYGSRIILDGSIAYFKSRYFDEKLRLTCPDKFDKLLASRVNSLSIDDLTLAQRKANSLMYRLSKKERELERYINE